ncbi:MAG: OprO/OprP family phosphate-selective porin [Cystobacterineae bacterium]|nr:OprO/OprP family phosphate-selective porin [Cystobacterineae bacterium]
MQKWKNLIRSVAMFVFCGALMASAQNEGGQKVSEETSEQTLEETLEANLPAEEAETPSQPPVETPPPTPTPAPVAVSDKPDPKQLGVGTEGFFRPGILLQGWFVAQRAEETSTTFRLRRAELHAKGDIVPGLISYAAMIDPAKLLEFKDTTVNVKGADGSSVTVKQPGSSAVSILQDFFITVKSPYVDISLGQFKIPVSWEGYNSSSRILFPERAMVSREFGDKRDLGIRFSKNFKYFGYSAGVFNGAGQNVLDVDNAKDIAVRLEAYPVQGLVIAGVAYMTLGSRKTNAKDRYEVDVRYENGPFLFQAEYIRAHDVKNSAPSVNGQGFYGAIAWTFLDVLQPCFRIGYMDPNVQLKTAAGGKDRSWQYDVGLNYYLRKHEVKFQLAYGRVQYRELKPSNEFILAGQVAF